MSTGCQSIFIATGSTWRVWAFVASIALTGLPMAAAQAPPAASPAAAPAGPPVPGTAPAAPATPPAATSKSPCELLDQETDDQARQTSEQRFAKQLYDNARLPQPLHGVLSSNVLPAEGLSRLTIDKKINEVEQSCVMAYLVDDAEGLINLRRLHFRSINVDTFKDTASGTESTRIFFSIPQKESPRRWLYKPATLILGAYRNNGGEPILSFSLPVRISSRTFSRGGGLVFAVVAYLCAALAAWQRTGGGGRQNFSLSPVQITAGVLGSGSISQLQVFFFSLLVASMLFFLWLWTGLLSNISEDLLMLMGISSLGAVGAKYTASVKSQLSEETMSFLHSAGWFSGPPITKIVSKPNMGDLLLTNNRLDVYKFQMAVFSVLVAIYILGAGTTDLGEVKISTTLLYLIGISQGVYVGGKAIAEREQPLDDRVKSMKALKAAYASEPDTGKKTQIAADYQKTATAAREDFRALMNIDVDDAKLKLA